MVITNLDLNSIINKLTETTCLDRNRTVLNKCIIFLAKKFLNNEAVLFPEVYDLYLSKPVVSSSDTKIDAKVIPSTQIVLAGL